MGKTLVLATRRSPLALAQAGLVAALLRRSASASDCELLRGGDDRRPTGRMVARRPRAGKGPCFTNELEAAALTSGRGGRCGPQREGPPRRAGGGPRDRRATSPTRRGSAGCPRPTHPEWRPLADGSPRGAPAAAARRPSCFPPPTSNLSEIRGNVDTRLREDRRKAESRTAPSSPPPASSASGIRCLARPRPSFALEVGSMVPAVGQGAIALQCTHGPGRGPAGRAVLDRPGRPRPCPRAGAPVRRLAAAA